MDPDLPSGEYSGAAAAFSGGAGEAAEAEGVGGFGDLEAGGGEVGCGGFDEAGEGRTQRLCLEYESEG